MADAKGIDAKEIDSICKTDDATDLFHGSIFGSEEEMRTSFSRFCYGNFYTVGSIWIKAFKTALVGEKFRLFPVVKAVKPEPAKKPPKTGYKELPLYKSPHYEYKNQLECEESCPKANQKLLHQALLPHVKNLRLKANTAFCKAYCSLKETYRDVKTKVIETKNDFKKNMRAPENLSMRQGVVAAGTITGYILGRGGGIPRRIFFTSLGALAAGSLCFPKETDEIFRNIAYHTAKFGLVFYNGLCNKHFSLDEKLPCRDELPKEPGPRPSVCPKK